MKVSMKKDDLTQIKHVGSARQKVLNDHGIILIEQLYEIPVEKLAEIRSIGAYYAKQIKNAVIEYFTGKGEKLPGEVMSDEEKKRVELNLNLQKKIKRMKKRLNRLNENLKPLWKKKYLSLYISFKKKANKLKSRLDRVNQQREDLSEKVKKDIINQADILGASIKKGSKKPKKKKYKGIIREIQSFSKMLKDINV